MLSVIRDCSVLIIVFNLQFCIEFTLTTLYALRPTPDARRPTPDARRPTPCALRPTPYAICSTLYALRSTLYATLHFPPSTLYTLCIYEFISSRIFDYSLH